MIRPKTMNCAVIACEACLKQSLKQAGTPATDIYTTNCAPENAKPYYTRTLAKREKRLI